MRELKDFEVDQVEGGAVVLVPILIKAGKWAALGAIGGLGYLAGKKAVGKLKD